MLGLQQTQADAVQWWCPSLSPMGPVLGQSRVVRRRRAWHQLVPDDAGPREPKKVGVVVTVAKDPPVLPGPVERAEVPVHNPVPRLVRVATFGPLVGERPQIVVQL